MPRTLTSSAPGSIMITGEHAVVYGHRAIVAAIDQRVSVRLTERDDGRVRITSGIAAPYDAPLDGLTEDHAYRFVLAAIRLYSNGLTGGITLDITSQIDPTLGLGSSAAVTVATLGVLAAFTDADRAGLHGQALAIIRSLQGRGSGADLAASVQGGMLAYRALPDPVLTPLPAPPPLALKYCGYKTPTAEVLARIAARMEGQEAAFDALYARMGEAAERAIGAAQAGDWTEFAQCLTQYQDLMSELGVSDLTLDRLIAEARQNASVLTAKISGSGLGDCVLALGAVPPGWAVAQLDQKGLLIDA